MPFRDRMKRAFGNSSSDPSKPKKQKPPANVYKPGEEMPNPKYRGPYNQAHQDKLSAFSFGDAWKRRKSATSEISHGPQGSDYSPMGSKLHSRGPSRGPSRRGSGWSGWSGKMRGMGSRQNSRYVQGQDGVEESAMGDDDVGNVGLSRQHTAEHRRPHPDDDVDMNGLEPQMTVMQGTNGVNGGMEELENQTTVTNGRPFTEEELATALTQSTLRPSKRERE